MNYRFSRAVRRLSFFFVSPNEIVMIEDSLLQDGIQRNKEEQGKAKATKFNKGKAVGVLSWCRPHWKLFDWKEKRNKTFILIFFSGMVEE